MSQNKQLCSVNIEGSSILRGLILSSLLEASIMISKQVLKSLNLSSRDVTLFRWGFFRKEGPRLMANLEYSAVLTEATKSRAWTRGRGSNVSFHLPLVF